MAIFNDTVKKVAKALAVGVGVGVVGYGTYRACKQISGSRTRELPPSAIEPWMQKWVEDLRAAGVQ